MQERLDVESGNRGGQTQSQVAMVTQTCTWCGMLLLVPQLPHTPLFLEDLYTSRFSLHQLPHYQVHSFTVTHSSYAHSTYYTRKVSGRLNKGPQRYLKVKLRISIFFKIRLVPNDTLGSQGISLGKALSESYRKCPLIGNPSTKH